MSARANQKLQQAWRLYVDEVIGSLISSHVPRRVIYTNVFTNQRAWNVYVFVRGQLRHAAILVLESNGDVTLLEQVFAFTQGDDGALLSKDEIKPVPEMSEIFDRIMSFAPKKGAKRQNRGQNSQNIGSKPRKQA